MNDDLKKEISDFMEATESRELSPAQMNSAELWLRQIRAKAFSDVALAIIAGCGRSREQRLTEALSQLVSATCDGNVMNRHIDNAKRLL